MPQVDNQTQNPLLQSMRDFNDQNTLWGYNINSLDSDSVEDDPQVMDFLFSTEQKTSHPLQEQDGREATTQI